MLLNLNRPERHRYVEFKDGQFVTIHQTKASSRLATQEDKQRFNDSFSIDAFEQSETSQVGLEKEESLTFFEQIIPPVWKKGMNLIFLVFLIMMAFIIFQLSRVFLSDTQAYLETHQIPLMEQIESFFSSDEANTPNVGVNSTELVLTDLTQVMHIQHSINESYEELKVIIRNYASGRMMSSERNQYLTPLLTEMSQLESYNQTRLDDRSSSAGEALYKANALRIQNLIQVIETLLTSNSRRMSLDQLNAGIENDRPLFEQQVQAFKNALDENNIPYTEKNGKLHFSFEGI